MTVYAQTPEKITYDSRGRRDPFIPLVHKTAVISGLSGVISVDDIQLEGVVVDRKHGSIVIANGVVLREGETQDGVKVIEIREDGVSFDIKGNVQFKPFNADAPMEENQ